jgi:pimeloyl-ACP methyl ester carboxylesterase
VNIYGIGGLGADKRVFKNLNLNYNFIPIDWIAPFKNETISDYANRFSRYIDKKEEYIILGVSFGGLVAIEISKVLNPKMTILISSAETRSELPLLFRFIGKTHLLRILPIRLFNPPKRLAHYFFQTKRKKLLDDILNDTDLNFTKWALNELVVWNNRQTLKNILKISGDADRIIPPKKKDEIKLIKGGGHFMIVDRAEEISQIINEKVSKTVYGT